MANSPENVARDAPSGPGSDASLDGLAAVHRSKALRARTLGAHEREPAERAGLVGHGQRLGSTGTFCWNAAEDEMVWSAQLYRLFEFEPTLPVTLTQVEARLDPEDVSLFRDSIHRARRTGSDFEHELRLRTSDHSVRYLHLVAQRAHDARCRVDYIGAVQDVTEQLVARQTLEAAQSELAHVNRVVSLGVLTASIAHEINQPLSGIVTSAGTCLRMLAAEPPNLDGARETARRTIQFGNRAAEVTKRLRAMFSRKGVTAESIDLNEAAREVIALSLNDLRENRVQVHRELADDLPFVTGDRVQLQQVIVNLVLNAMDAMSAVEDRPRQLTIRTEKDERDRVHLTVRDTGVGFEPSTAERLFDAFYTTKNWGMGIGLSVSRSMVESHGGRLWAVPNDGPGASFSFFLPGVSGSGPGHAA